MNDLLEAALDPALIKMLAAAAEEQLGAQHAVTKALGAAVTATDPIVMEMARKLFGELPLGQRNMIWLTAKSRMASTRKSMIPIKRTTPLANLSDTPYTAADLSPKRVLH